MFLGQKVCSNSEVKMKDFMFEIKYMDFIKAYNAMLEYQQEPYVKWFVDSAIELASKYPELSTYDYDTPGISNVETDNNEIADSLRRLIVFGGDV